MLFKFLRVLFLTCFINVVCNATDDGYRGDNEFDDVSKKSSAVTIAANAINNEWLTLSVKNLSLVSSSANFSAALLSVFLTNPEVREVLWYYSTARNFCSSTYCVLGSLRNFLPDDHCLNNKWFVEKGIFPERGENSKEPKIELMSQDLIWLAKNSLRAYCYVNVGSELIKDMCAGGQPSSSLIFSYFVVVGIIDFIDCLNIKK